jgi:hypothetical protein
MTSQAPSKEIAEKFGGTDGGVWSAELLASVVAVKGALTGDQLPPLSFACTVKV